MISFHTQAFHELFNFFSFCQTSDVLLCSTLFFGVYLDDIEPHIVQYVCLIVAHAVETQAILVSLALNGYGEKVLICAKG